MNIVTASIIDKLKNDLVQSAGEFDLLDSPPAIFLVGSYATCSETQGSDIDIIIIVEQKNKDKYVTLLQNRMKKFFPDLIRKLDCKVLSKQEILHSRSLDYLFLFSALNNKIPLNQTKFQIKLSPMKLREALEEIQDRLTTIDNYISLEQNFDISVFSLFMLTKSIYYLNELIDPKSFEEETPRCVLGRFFYPAARVYEAYTDKGVSSTIYKRLVKRRQRSGNFHQLKTAYDSVQLYLEKVQAKFYKWFKHVDL